MFQQLRPSKLTFCDKMKSLTINHKMISRKKYSSFTQILINIFLHLAIFLFLLEILLIPEAPQFVGKGLLLRYLIIAFLLSFLFPFLFFTKRWKGNYPFLADSLYLSVFVLDMFGNSFNLYSRFFYFDLIPHFLSTGVLTVLLGLFFFKRKLSNLHFSFLIIGLATFIHLGLEILEFSQDVLANTHNVRGASDTINDLLVGVLGSFLASFLLMRKRKREFIV